jgi:alpha-1,3-mannosyltransferase
LARWREISSDYQALRATLIKAAAFDWHNTLTPIWTSTRHCTEVLSGESVSVTVSTRSEVVDELDRRFDKNKSTVVAFANANCLNIAHRDPSLRAALDEALVLNDGIGIDLAGKLLFGVQFPDSPTLPPGRPS